MSLAKLCATSPPGTVGKKQKPRDCLGAFELNDACPVHPNKPDDHVKLQFEVRATSEGEGIEP